MDPIETPVPTSAPADPALVPPMDAMGADAQVTAITDVAAAPSKPVGDTAPQADGVPPASADHAITHRSFAREDASAPMVVTTITTRDTLRASLGE